MAIPDLTVSAESFDQHQVRLIKREQLNSGNGAYLVEVPITHTITQVRELYPDLDVNVHTGDTVGIAGRIIFQRNNGKLLFATLQEGNGSRIQLMISLAEVGEESIEKYRALTDLGDHLFVEGEVGTSMRGELSIYVHSWQIASKTLRPLPNNWDDLSEETRVRQRYLDLIQRPEARDVVRLRAKVNQSVRATFDAHDFIEVETPMLQTLQGGATARPFVTHSNAYDMDLYLRIAPELFLKRAVVGGLDRVFEINRNFRNEGSDSTHNPEFSMIEAYQTYTDYNGIADLTQEIVQNAAIASTGSTTVTLADGTEYDLGGQWSRISLYGSLSEVSNRVVTPQTSVEELSVWASELGLKVSYPTHGKYIEELWEHYVKPTLTSPTFVMDFPVDTSPLVRQHRSIAGVVEKWDLYVRGFELATGYSELVDPVIQRERLVAQALLSGKGDLEAMQLDEDFLRALEHGMPPTGGMGMGVDRLIMAITGLGIRDTVLFPLVK